MSKLGQKRMAASLYHARENRLFRLLRNTTAFFKKFGIQPYFVLDVLNNKYLTSGPEQSDNLSGLMTSVALGNATVIDKDRVLKWRLHNLFLNSATGATQSITVVSGVAHSIRFKGTGSIVYSGAAAGTLTGTGANDIVRVEITAGSTTLTCTVSGSITVVGVYRSDLGGMQLNSKDGTDYLPTSGDAGYALRTDYSRLPVNGQTLVEPAGVNLFPNALDMNNATGWGNFRTDTSAGDAFLGTNTLYLTATANATSGSGSGVAIAATLSGLVAATYAMTCVAKAGPTDPGLLYIRPTDSSNLSNRAEAWFNLETGAVGTISAPGTNFTAATSKIVDLGGGEYRCSITFTTDATLAISPRFYLTDADASLGTTIGKDIQLCGAQFEAYHVATSLIITGSSSEARAKDEASCVIADKIPGFIQGSGSIVFEASMDYDTGGSGTPRIVGIDDGSNNNRLTYFVSEGGPAFSLACISGGVAQFSVGDTIAGGAVLKSAVRYADDDAAYSAGGGAVSSDTSCTIPTGFTTIRIGRLSTGVEVPTRISHFSIGPYASLVSTPGWSNEQLAVISGP